MTTPGYQRFFAELKRRRVFRVMAMYGAVAFVILQVADIALPGLGLPEWTITLILALTLLGFPLAIVLAWAFDMTPEGMQRTADATPAELSQIIAAPASQRWPAGVLALVGIPALLAGAWYVGRQSAPAASAASADGVSSASIAVLPFADMSPDKDQEYFSDGISEELLNVLVRIQGLRVPSRTSSFTFKGSNLRVSEIGRELGVDHVLEGSVRKAGNRIRVTAQLIDVDTDTHLWSDTYTRELDDIFAVQDEIAHAIVEALKVTLSGEDEQMLVQKPTENVEAYNLYLRGRHQWNLRIPGRMAEAIEPLEKAIELDAGFDEAWAALGDVYLLLPEYGEGTVAENIPAALEAAQQALEINPNSAKALTTSAYIKAMYQYQWDEAESEFRRAIELDPNYRTAYQWYAEMLAALRRTDEAMEQLEIASEIDPLAPIIHHIKGWVMLWANQLEEAKQHYLDALQLDPGFPYAIGNLANTHALLGEYDEARARYREVAELLDNDPAPAQLAIDALEDPTLRDRVIEGMQKNTAVPTQPFSEPATYMLYERPDLALDLLLRNFEADGPYLPHVNRMKIFDPLREEPRFQEMLKEMNLWP